METITAVTAFAALAQETRLGIFRLLVKAGPAGLPAGEIAEKLDLPAPTLSFHLNQLRHAGLLHQERQSRSLIYSVRFDTVQALLRFLMEDCCQGQIPAEALTPVAGCCGPIKGASKRGGK